MTELDRDRSFELILDEDLSLLAKLAIADIKSLFERRSSIGVLYRDRLIALCLCQGAAEHYVRPGRGVKDFDVWAFFKAHPQAPFPARRRSTADFGLSKFGRHPSDAGYQGRRVDVLGRSLPGAEEPEQTDAIRNWLSGATTNSARHLRLRPVIANYPEIIRAKVLWDPSVDT